MIGRDKPADATLNIAVWQGAAPPPLDPMDFRATGGAADGGGRLQNLRPRQPRWLSADGLPSKAICPNHRVSLRRVERPRAGPVGEPPQLRRTDNRAPGRCAPRAGRSRELRASARALLGIEGASPSSAPLYPQGVGWLNHLTVVQASPRMPAKTLPARRLRRRWPGRLGQAPRPLCRQPHRRRGRTADPSLLGVVGARPRGPVSALPVPLGDRRSSILGHSTARRYPETPPESPETASEPVRGLRVRSRRSLPGLPDTPTNRPSGDASARTGRSACRRLRPCS